MPDLNWKLPGGSLSAKHAGWCKVIGQQGLIANIRSYDRQLHTDLVALNKRMASSTRATARKIVPRDTGRMQRSITIWFSEQGLVFTVGYDPKVFEEDKVVFYPFYVELGTRFMAARPTLIPAYMEARQRYQSELQKLMRRSARRGL